MAKLAFSPGLKIYNYCRNRANHMRSGIGPTQQLQALGIAAKLSA
jgi:hypothetical protein